MSQQPTTQSTCAEADLQLAVSDINPRCVQSSYRAAPHITLAKLSRDYMIKYKTLYDRSNGVSAGNRGGHNTRLTKEEDEGLKKYFWFLVRICCPPGKKDIVFGANQLLKKRGELAVSKDWGRRYLKRNKVLFKALRAKTLAAERKAVHQREEIQTHFYDFKAVLEEFGILKDNVWNFDEVGFRIGVLLRRMVIVPADVKAVYIADPDNRESLTSLECVSAAGKSIESLSNCTLTSRAR